MTGRDYIVAALCLAGMAFLVWKETARVNRLRVIWRLVASVITVASLGALMLPITVRVTKIPATLLKEAVWLTEGYNPDSLKKFLTKKENNIAVYVADENLLKSAGQYHPLFIASPVIFADSARQFKALHVFGYGFSREEIQHLRTLPYIFHPSSPPDGISSINWPRHITSGEPLLIQGRFHQEKARPVKLILNGLHTNLDSVLLTKSGRQQFELSAIPKHPGRALYSLIALSGTDTLEIETIPVEVEEPGVIRILFLASHPGFENKFLKSWLLKNGFPITTRTTISRNKYQKEFTNGKEIKVDRITGQLLDNFDVVISDAAELDVMTTRELSAIRKKVEEGLGLIIKTDSFGFPASFYARSFPLLHGLNDTKPAALHWGFPKFGPRLLVNDNGVIIKKMPGTKPLVWDEKSGIHVSSSLFGSGKLVLTTLDNTYSWALAGNDTAYQSLWSMIIQKAVPEINAVQYWQIQPAFPKPDKPVQLALQTGQPGMITTVIGKSRIYLGQNIDYPIEWQGIYWPTQAGWQSIEQQDVLPSWFYIFRDTEWLCLEAFNKMDVTKNFAESNRQFVPVANIAGERNERRPLSKMYFFMGILISCTYLWWEKKYTKVY